MSLAAIRAQPSDKSEMISQLLFGETVFISGHKDGWRQVVCTWDETSGWVDAKQLIPITPSEYEACQAHPSFSLSLVEGLMASDHFIPLTMGATLPQYDGLRCRLGDHSYQFSGPVVAPSEAQRNSHWIVKVARRYLNAPHLWGGRSPFGIDSAGLVQMVFKSAGVRLLRNPAQQVAQGHSVDFMEQCQAGDLAFFDNGKGEIHHVGIILPDCHVIHASGKVRLDKLDHFGIFNAEQNRYTHQLRLVKRLLPEEKEQISADDNKSGTTDDLINQTALFA